MTTWTVTVDLTVDDLDQLHEALRHLVEWTNRRAVVVGVRRKASPISDLTGTP